MEVPPPPPPSPPISKGRNRKCVLPMPKKPRLDDNLQADDVTRDESLQEVPPDEILEAVQTRAPTEGLTTGAEMPKDTSVNVNKSEEQPELSFRQQYDMLRYRRHGAAPKRRGRTQFQVEVSEARAAADDTVAVDWF